MFTPDELMLIAKVLQGELDTIRFIGTRVPGLEASDEMMMLLVLKKKALVLAAQPTSEQPAPKPTERKD